ncbi:MAG: hypothetical protein RL227_1621, partial [Pseudomonadota bacterium]
MLAQENSSASAAADMPPPVPIGACSGDLLAAADLQDHLMVAHNDLERLQRLLTDACDQLMGHFYGASGELRSMLRHDAHAAVADSSAAPLPADTPQLHKA